PAPYERACMIAHYLKTHKPKSKLILLDAKRTFTKQAVFEEAFATLYKDHIELVLTDEIDDNAVVRVDTATREVVTRSGRKVKADVANIIPPQRAGEIAAITGCTDGDWCPVKHENFKSAAVEDVYILGDAAVANEMPKSAFSANSQGIVVAADILAEVAGKPRTPAVFHNTCWSMLGPDNSAKIGAQYKPGVKDGKPGLVASAAFVSKTGETAALRRQNHQEGAAWYGSLTKQIYPRTPEGPEEEPAPQRPRKRRR
ncbi:MAG: FCSD flavin-binding domain-containing protein, partial [Hyphomicrobiaceae bacterium]